MKEHEFKSEIKDYVEKSYEEFIEYKNIIRKIFAVFHEICEKNQITYYYAFGSLLGAIRDKGMIPWDADIDVMVPINQVNDLISALNKELPSEYYIESNFTTTNYYLCEMRICSKKYDSQYIHLDIFYLIGAPSDDKELSSFDRKVKRMFLLRAWRYQDLEKGKNTKDNIIYYAKKIVQKILKIEPDFIFNYRCNKMLWKYNFIKSQNYIVWASGAEIFPKNIFEPKRIIDCEGNSMYIPNDSDKFLEIRYGDYNSYLPINDRFDEFYNAYKRFKNSKI